MDTVDVKYILQNFTQRLTDEALNHEQLAHDCLEFALNLHARPGQWHEIMDALLYYRGKVPMTVDAIKHGGVQLNPTITPVHVERMTQLLYQAHCKAIADAVQWNISKALQGTLRHDATRNVWHCSEQDILDNAAAVAEACSLYPMTQAYSALCDTWWNDLELRNDDGKLAIHVTRAIPF